MPPLRHPVGVVVLTWGEIALFLALVMENKYRRPLLVAVLCSTLVSWSSTAW